MYKATRNYNAFIAKMAAEGIDAFQANQFPEAREAHQLDEREDWNVKVHAKAETWTNYDATGNKIDYFQNQGEMMAAMSDPLYAASKPYRDAIARMIGNTPESMIPTEDSQSFGGLRGMSAEKMLAGARKDAAISEYKRLAVEAAHDPMKRVQLMEAFASTDPAVQEWVALGADSVNPEGPGHRAVRAAGYQSVGPDLGAAMAGNSTEEST